MMNAALSFILVSFASTNLIALKKGRPSGDGFIFMSRWQRR